MKELVWTPADVERFMSFVEILPCGCWFWNGARSKGHATTKSGPHSKFYGSFWLPGFNNAVRAHRFSAEAIRGLPALEPGQHRDHACRFSLCVNPWHLEIVTHAENELRRQQNTIYDWQAVVAWHQRNEELGNVSGVDGRDHAGTASMVHQGRLEFQPDRRAAE